MKVADSINELREQAETLWADQGGSEHQKEAAALFHRLYDLGDRAWAGYRLGIVYYQGRGVFQNLDLAYKYLSIPELDKIRFALYYRGLILKNPNFSGYNEARALELLKLAHGMGVEQAATYISELMERQACPICESVPSANNVARGRCPNCGSFDTQRVFMAAYSRSMRYCYDLTGKDGLIAGPLGAARTLFCKIGAGELTVVDTKSGVQDGTSLFASLSNQAFDFIFVGSPALYERDLDAISVEFHRLLRPGGMFITVNPVSGDEIGSFRYSKEDLINKLAPHFRVQVFGAIDALTKNDIQILTCKKETPELLENIEKSRKSYIQSIVDKNKFNERGSGCKFSQSYLQEKLKNPQLTYATFSVAAEADAVSQNAAHATLGLNITDRSKEQGSETFALYREILQVKSDDKVVEYGCGSLRVGSGFINLLGPDQFFGLDIVSVFYELGCRRIGTDVISEKGVRFHVIDDEGIRLASAFRADHVYAPAVLFHIHPDDIQLAIQYLVSLASKPGAKLIFDAKVTRDDEPKRYAQMSEKGGWAWPLRFYQEAFSPLEFVGIHKRVKYTWEPSVDVAHMEYRMPFPKR